MTAKQILDVALLWFLWCAFGTVFALAWLHDHWGFLMGWSGCAFWDLAP